MGFPYIIFGPPGTGKTVTIVEIMKQVNLKAVSIVVVTFRRDESLNCLLNSKQLHNIYTNV